MLKWAVCLFRAPYASSLGCKHRPGAVRVVLGPYDSSLCSTCRLWAVRMVLEPCVSPWRRTSHLCVVRIVLGCTRRCWAARFRLSHGVGKRSSRWGCPTRRWSPLLYCRGSPGRRGYAGSVRPPAIWRRVERYQWGENEGGKGENEPRHLSWLAS